MRECEGVRVCEGEGGEIECEGGEGVRVLTSVRVVMA